MSWSLDDGVASEVAAWLATYLAHSVALFLVAFACARLVQSARVREQLWRAALFGPLVTASLQLGAGLAPIGGQWSLGTEAPVELSVQADVRSAAPAAERTAAVVASPAQIALLLEQKRRELAALTEPRVDAAPESFVAAVPVTRASAARKSWTRSASILVALGIAVLMVRALLEAIRMHRLGDRRPADDPALLRMVEELRATTGLRRRIRLELTERGASAYATGVLRPRIVLPAHAVDSLESGAVRAMLAHEIGHIVRLDPAWAAAVRSVSALFFFQPLNLITARNLDECAEFCCDEFAVDATGDEVALARCLATVAEWIVGPSRSSAQAACTMAHSGSPLAERVQRILATEGRATKVSSATRWLGIAAVGMTAVAAPGFATERRSNPGPTPSVAARLDVPASESTVTVELRAATPRDAVIEQLSEAVRLLGHDIREVRTLCEGRKVSASTLARLASLDARCMKLQSIASTLQRRARSRFPVR